MPRLWLLRLLIALLALSLHGTARAALTLYLDLPGVNGESNAPGRADVTVLDSLALAPSSFDATKLVDSTSPALQSAAVGGTPYAHASLLFYDDVATDVAPDAALVLDTALITSIQVTSLGGNPGETVSFSFASPTMSLFLELPGVSGESSAPGHPGVIALESIRLSGNDFSVLKTVDSTSVALATAAVSGTPFATATLLFYSDVLSETRPDFSIVYHTALVSSIAAAPSQNIPKELVDFAAVGATVSAPEPSLGLLLLVLVGLRFRS